MEFLLLGPVEVRAAGRLVDSGGPRQRSVLAALAVDAGRSVLVDTMVDRVWGSTPPARARHALYVYVGRIRAMLRNAAAAADCTPAPLVRGPRGYQLNIDPGRVDMHRCRQLIDEAHDPTRPDSTKGVLLRQALELWRGVPLADLSGEWAAQVREGWRQLRLDAVLRWARLELESGDPGAVAGPLTDLLSDNPFDESLAAALMRTFAAAGRNADALRCYANMRERLVRELGIEPGPDLQGTHLMILRGDSPARRTGNLTTDASVDPRDEVQPIHLPVAVPDRGKRRSQARTPAQLPSDIRGFAGRLDALARLDAIVAASDEQPKAAAVAVVTGTAGVGKTNSGLEHRWHIWCSTCINARSR